MTVTSILVLALLQPAPTADDARAALDRAVGFLAQDVACHGGYLWRYSEDLTVFEGEGPASESMIWIQPPGTPALGMAFYDTWRLLGDERCLEAAEAAGHALVEAQLACGGWDYAYDFAPEAANRFHTRLDARAGLDPAGRNQGTMDDDNTQSAVRLLAWLNATRPDPAFAEALDAAIGYLLDAQMDHGAWPQRHPGATGYAAYATFNDATINDIMRTLWLVGDLTGRQDAYDAVLRAGAFILLSQGEPPQAGWAQQYDEGLQPAWARKFEPPAWCPAVTARNISTLVFLYNQTGEDRWLEPVPRALEWLQSCRLADGRWPRFVEVGTNDPLYFTREYELVKTDDDLPTHYSFQGEYGIPAAIRRYEAAVAEGPIHATPAKAGRAPAPDPNEAARLSAALGDRVAEIIASQDGRGAWVEDGWIECNTAIANLRDLSRYVWAMEAMQH